MSTTTKPPAMNGTYTDRENSWTWNYRNGRGGCAEATGLYLIGEINGTPMSDDFLPSEISAADLLEMWVRRFVPDRTCELNYGPGTVSISWFVHSKPDGIAEPYPFSFDIFDFEGGDTEQYFRDNFWYKYFSHPRHNETGEPLNWNRLPVRDGTWNNDPRGYGTKGGFFQEATGWKPSPGQPYVHLPSVFAAAGLRHLIPFSQHKYRIPERVYP